MDDRTRSRRHGLSIEPPALDVSSDSFDVLGHTDDETAAADARLRYRFEEMPALDPDGKIAPLLCPTERLLAVRRGAIVDRRQPTASASDIGLVGDLYLTSTRLVHVGRLTLSFPLDEIAEAVLAADRLLLVTRDGSGVALEVDRPRLLRVEIATARAALRT